METLSAAQAHNKRPTIPPLTVGARRRAVCELADIYYVEQSSNDRPLTDALPGLLPGLVAENMHRDLAIEMFDRIARCRAAGGRADVSYDVIAAAQVRAERLLDTLVGEVAA